MNRWKRPGKAEVTGLFLLLVLTACSGLGSDEMDGTGIGMDLVFPDSHSRGGRVMQQAGAVPLEVNYLYVRASLQPGGAEAGQVEIQNPHTIESAKMNLTLAADNDVLFRVSALGSRIGHCLYVGSRTQRIIFGAANTVAIQMYHASFGCDFMVNFPDGVLASAVRGALGFPQGADIPASALRGLQRLDFDYRNIVDLTGLEYCINVWELILSDNQINDLSPLSGLTGLTDLNLDLNSIMNIDALSGLINLRDLSLAGNRITDIGALVNNPGLGTGDDVQLSNNPLSNQACNVDIPILQGRGVTVSSDCA